MQRPSEDTLRSLYIEQRLTTRDIGSRYRVAHISVRRWLAKYAIPVRPSGCGLKNRGLAEPTKEQLYALVHLQHKSYREIAAMFDVHESAIKFWLDKHGIDRPGPWDSRHKGRRLPVADELRHLYVDLGKSTAEIGGLFGISSGAVQDRCRKAGIQLRRDGFNGGSRIQCTDRHLVRSTYEQRVCEWLNARRIAHDYEPQLPFDRRYHADFLAGGCFIEIWGIVNNSIYKARTAHKRALYRANNATLIELPVHAFHAAHKNLWERLLLPLISSSAQDFSHLSQMMLFRHRQQA